MSGPRVALDPAVSRGRLLRVLRELRTGLGLTQSEVAEALGWSGSTVIRFETGRTAISQVDLVALLVHYGVDDRVTMADLGHLARLTRRLTWSHYRDILSPEHRIYLGFESSATYLRSLDVVVIPELLQTPSYVHQRVWSLTGPGTSDTDRYRLRDVCLVRQKRLQDDGGLRAHFVVDEAALHRGVAGAGAGMMREQLEALSQAAGRPNITVQVVPFSAGLHRGLTGSFSLVSAEGTTDGDCLYREHQRTTGSALANRAEEFSEHEAVFTSLTELAP